MSFCFYLVDRSFSGHLSGSGHRQVIRKQERCNWIPQCCHLLSRCFLLNRWQRLQQQVTALILWSILPRDAREQVVKPGAIHPPVVNERRAVSLMPHYTTLWNLFLFFIIRYSSNIKKSRFVDWAAGLMVWAHEWVSQTKRIYHQF